MAQKYYSDSGIMHFLAEFKREEDEVAAAEGFLARDKEDLHTECDIDDTDPDYEPQVILTTQENSDSEVELSDGDGCDDEGDDLKFYGGKDLVTIWANRALTPQLARGKDTNTPGPKGQARQCQTSLECFFQIITAEDVENIVKYTNIFIENKKLERVTLSGKSEAAVRERDYKPTTITEILALFGALFLIAVKRGNHADISEFFNKNGTGLSILRGNFSEKRFRFLLRSLRFDNIDTREERKATDKLAPVREILSSFTSNSQKAFALGEFATIGEMLVPFRGRCSFIQFVPAKPGKYGIKMYALADASTFYTSDLEVQCSASATKPSDVVVKLVQSIDGTGRNVTTNNYYSSYPLAEHLLSMKITFLGTLSKDNPEIPPEFLTVDKTSGRYKFGWQPDKTLISMTTTTKKKAVVVLSTMHDSDSVDESTGKPTQVVDYNLTKGGVNTVDLMCSKISTSRVTKRWPMTVFFRLLDLAGINSFRIFQFNNPQQLKKNTRRHYLYDLSFELMKENLKLRSLVKSLPKDLVLFLETFRDQECPEVQQVPTKRGICHICGSKKNNRSKLECGQCKKNVCRKHSLSVTTCQNCQSHHDIDDVMDES